MQKSSPDPPQRQQDAPTTPSSQLSPWTISTGHRVSEYVPKATLLYQDAETQVDAARIDGDQLWLALSGLEAATGWDLEPEGVCKSGICVPVPDARRSELIRDDLFNLTAFADLIQQPVAHDKKNSIWYFGPAGWEWKSRLTSRHAPDFTLPDLAGQSHSLSELRGKKVFLLFWASW